MTAQAVQGEFNRSGTVLHLLLRYTQALITQMSQTAVCNRHHSLDQQLCRWLLLSLDRLQGSELAMTQELIANMLGVRREGVTNAATKLQAAGVIRYGPRAHQRARPPGAGTAQLRVLCRGQEGVRSAAAALQGGLGCARYGGRLVCGNAQTGQECAAVSLFGSVVGPQRGAGPTSCCLKRKATYHASHAHS